ncbi:MAG: UPF0280 family protein [Deltaproteobacteria bacterium]|nr:UPF0280 family protein [Deltaproteobacteria bacterium]
MSYRRSITTTDDDWTVVDYGPMYLRIKAARDGKTEPEMVREAAELSMTYLDRVARLRKDLSRPAIRIEQIPGDEIAERMIKSVRMIGDADLTPMAAVAGTLADFVADWLQEQGATKVIVDNGGDIAVRLEQAERAGIGVRPDIRSLNISHVVHLDSRSRSWGITTSGLGGRSFTRGIASAVTVVALTASIADAASTAIGNACMVEDESIRQVPADRLDPDTDLIGVPVTVQVGALSRQKFACAVERAQKKGEDLSRQGIIFGALIAAGGVFSMTEKIKSIMTEASSHSNRPPIGWK